LPDEGLQGVICRMRASPDRFLALAPAPGPGHIPPSAWSPDFRAFESIPR